MRGNYHRIHLAWSPGAVVMRIVFKMEQVYPVTSKVAPWELLCNAEIKIDIHPAPVNERLIISLASTPYIAVHQTKARGSRVAGNEFLEREIVSASVKVVIYLLKGWF